MLRYQRWRRDGEWLRWPGFLARNVRGGYRPLLDWEERLAGPPVKAKQHAHLGRLDHDRDADAGPLDIRQHRLRRDVVVPQVVVHELPGPDHLAARRVQCDQRIGMAVVSKPFTAIIIRARGSGRGEDQVQFLIHRQWRPDIGSSGARRLLRSPVRGIIGIRLARNGMPLPAQFAVAGVIGPDRAEAEVRFPVVDHAGAEYDRIVNNYRRRSDGVSNPPVLVAQRGFEVGFAVTGKVLAAFAGGRVQRDQPCVQRADKDPFPAGLSRWCSLVGPVDNPPVGNFAVICIGINLCIKSPAFSAALCINGEYAVKGSGKVQSVAGQHRCRLETVLVTRAEALSGFTGAESPDRRQPFEIVAVHLARSRKARASLVISIPGPANVGQPGLGGGRTGQFPAPVIG